MNKNNNSWFHHAKAAAAYFCWFFHFSTSFVFLTQVHGFYQIIRMLAGSFKEKPVKTGNTVKTKQKTVKTQTHWKTQLFLRCSVFIVFCLVFIVFPVFTSFSWTFWRSDLTMKTTSGRSRGVEESRSFFAAPCTRKVVFSTWLTEPSSKNRKSQ